MQNVHCLQPCVNKQERQHSCQLLMFCTLFISQPLKFNTYFGKQDGFNKISDFVVQLVSLVTKFNDSFIVHLLCFNQQVNPKMARKRGEGVKLTPHPACGFFKNATFKKGVDACFLGPLIFCVTSFLKIVCY